METLKIVKIARFTTKQDGTPLMTKFGKPYTSVRIQTTEPYLGKWISGFGDDVNAQWKEGDEVEVEVVQKGEYLNFNMPKKQDISHESLERIQNTQVKHTIMLNQIVELLKPKKPSSYPTESNVTSFDEPTDYRDEADGQPF